jgi:hypothetical protein
MTPNTPIPIVPPIGGASPVAPPIGGGASPFVPPIGGRGPGGSSLPPIGPPTSPLIPEATPVIPPGGLAPLPAVNPPSGVTPPAGFVPPLPGVAPPVTPPGFGTPPGPPVTPPAGLASPGGEPRPFTPPFEPTPVPKVNFSKSGGTTDVTPIAVSPPASLSAPKTTFDLDLHAVKATDTYESICREYFNDAKYAIALKEFNRGKPLSSGGMLEIPSFHVLKKQFPGSIAPAGRTTSGVSPDWAASATPPATPSGTRPTEFRASKSGTYTVPAGGATFKQIARLTLGSDQRWVDIWNMNPSFTRADEVLPAGTVVKLPSDARIPE